jgi:hypothetical protein
MVKFTSAQPQETPSWKVEVAFGYLLQIVSILLLLAQHFLLPLFLGLGEYGRLTFTIGCASLLFSGFDHGFNLLAVRKPKLGPYYLRNKLIFLVFTAFGFLFYVKLGNPIFNTKIVVPVLLQALFFVFYTYSINYEIAIGQIKRVVLFSLVNGVLLVLTPITFAATGIDIIYGPFSATVLSLLLLVIVQRRGVKFRAYSSIILRPLRMGHLRKSFIKQCYISFGTIIDATIVWLGVIVVAIHYGYETAAVYRIVMSAISLLTQTLPLPKQVLIRKARTTPTYFWAYRYIGMLVLAGLAQVLVVYLLGKPVLSMMFPEKVDAIYYGVLLLSPITILKTIFELQTILFDRANSLSWQFWNILIAIVPAIIVFTRQDVYWAILSFYLTLCLASVISFFWSQRLCYPTAQKSISG